MSNQIQIININSDILNYSEIARLLDYTPMHIINVGRGIKNPIATQEKIKRVIINELFPKSPSRKITKSRSNTNIVNHK